MSEPVFRFEGINLYHGDCLEVLGGLPENSLDAVVTDPPYEIGFMGKSWDASGVAFSHETWRLVWRVMKPGAHLVAFGAPKNYHRLACAIEDAGFEIRDSLMWVFGSGFPKSLDVSKAIDKSLGVEGTYGAPKSAAHAGWIDRGRMRGDEGHEGFQRPWMQDEAAVDRAARKYEGGSDAAREWEGWGTALKPAYEPIVLARKPLSESTVAANVLRWGTGALNIDATRIATHGEKISPRGSMDAATDINDGWSRPWMANEQTSRDRLSRAIEKAEAIGRWPANLCHDGSQDVLDMFPHTNTSSGEFKRKSTHGVESNVNYASRKNELAGVGYGDAGSAARFFYCAKASKHDRAGSKHPTVKPVALMRWLVRLVTPPNGTVLDPFAGSGTTGKAVYNENFRAILIERELEYIEDIRRRFL